MKQVTVITPISLSSTEIETIKKQLNLATTDAISVEIDASLIAGLKIVVDGKALDLSVKCQLAEIVGNN